LRPPTAPDLRKHRLGRAFRRRRRWHRRRRRRHRYLPDRDTRSLSL